ncbi:MAG: DUF998 domain-containing protein [Fimbriimonadales bacterium]
MLLCGILSPLLYVAMNVIAASLYEGYNSASQTISELSAIGAPTRTLWVGLGVLYTLLLAAFGWGVWRSAGQKVALRVVAGLMIAQAVIGPFWPPMHQRVVLAAGGKTMTDTMHITFTVVWGLLAMLTIGFGATAFGRRFRLYSIATFAMLVGFGVWTGFDSPRMEANLPTPWIGVAERINAGAYLLWVIVLAIALLRAPLEQPQSGDVTGCKGEKS